MTTGVSSMTAVSSGLWRLSGGSVQPVDRSWAGPVTLLVPSERVLIRVVDLPFPSRAKRAAAAPFALEDAIAEPLGEVHVALGTEVAPGRHLCAVVRHALMREWVASAEAVGMADAVLMPDAMAVPLPPAGAWRLVVADGRALVRTDDGAGFAVEIGLLPALWEAADRPTLLASGDAVPDAMRDGVAEASLELADGRPVVVAPPVDLRQGLYAAARGPAWGPWKVAAALAVGGAAAHLALAVIDVTALHFMAERREAETRALITARDASLAQTPDLVAAVDRLAPEAAGGDGPFVRTLSRAAGALAGRPLSYRAVTYGGAGQATALAVTAPDMAEAEAAAQALTARALPATVTLDPVSETAAATGVNAVITLNAGGAG
ncbi:type II secretion system protein GspL [Brevundimonas sp.]|jgi:general secretion pathway protein L|uniref:type II secretion system protein GspL n=1 Tax=Brevundimonas sp. TaxID=1871086 RepID=UPI002E107095|nr:type II secretion system protein GspL [Brevundimonas sp.]